MKPKQDTKHEADKLVRDFAFLLQNQSGRQAVSVWVYQDAGERIDVSSRIWFGRDLREAKRYMPMRPRGGVPDGGGGVNALLIHSQFWSQF